MSDMLVQTEQPGSSVQMNILGYIRPRPWPDKQNAPTPAPAAAQGNCQCIDCFGDQPQHDPNCVYMKGLHSEQPTLASMVRALTEYPAKNPQQLQARKVCEGVLALAKSYGEVP
jgi:hypothetical protein